MAGYLPPFANEDNQHWTLTQVFYFHLFVVVLGLLK